MKKTFCVYVVLHMVKDCEKVDRDIMVMNVQAYSNGGAEHEVLDNCAGVDNALAFSTDEMCGAYFNDILRRCTVYDLRDFRSRCAAWQARRAEVLEALHDEMQAAFEAWQEAKKASEAAQLQEIAANTACQNAAQAFRDAVKLYGMHDFEPTDEVPGIA